jgi:hypothetical protein
MIFILPLKISSHSFRLRKVKMDQRKLMDNASTITDMAKVRLQATYIYTHHTVHMMLLLFQTQNSVYEVLSDVNSRQDVMEERLVNIEDRMNTIQCSLDVLPDILSRFVILCM